MFWCGIYVDGDKGRERKREGGRGKGEEGRGRERKREGGRGKGEEGRGRRGKGRKRKEWMGKSNEEEEGS